MNTKHLILLKMHHRFSGIAQTNVNEVHRASLSLNDRIACWVGGHIGTMWFCYALALLMIAWAILQAMLGQAAPDRYPYPFLFFCLGGIMQSLLMPLLMVKANLDARHSELLAEQSYAANQEILTKLTHIEENLKPKEDDHS